jgi:hypothetical protein
MAKTEDTTNDAELTTEQWLAIRKEAGLKIDPKTAEVTWFYAQTMDPYGVNPDLPEELWQVGREYFARSPGSDIWVSFDDLPDATRKALLDRVQPSITVKNGSARWNFETGDAELDARIKALLEPSEPSSTQ